jgi:REP element-mobilizing transposase RayT
MTSKNFDPEFRFGLSDIDLKVYHITWVTHNSRLSKRMVKYKVKIGEPVILTNKEREIISKALNEKIKKEKYKVLALNILDDHVHCVLICKKSDVLEIVRNLKGYFSFFLSRNHNHGGLKPTIANKGRQTKIWANGYSNTFIETEKHLFNVIEYVQNNHLKHNISSLKTKDYPPLQI